MPKDSVSISALAETLVDGQPRGASAAFDQDMKPLWRRHFDHLGLLSWEHSFESRTQSTSTDRAPPRSNALATSLAKAA